MSFSYAGCRSLCLLQKAWSLSKWFLVGMNQYSSSNPLKKFLSNLAACGLPCKSRQCDNIVITIQVVRESSNMNFVHTTFAFQQFCHTSFFIHVCSVLPPLIIPVVVSALFLSSSVFCSRILVSHLNQSWCSLSLPLSLHYWSAQFKQTSWRKHTEWFEWPPLLPALISVR